jgi:hypothetical protein
MLYPEIFAEVLGLHDKVTECVGAVVPVPVSVAVVFVVCASLVTVNVADWAPAVDGLNVMVNESLTPAAIVCGRESPPTVKVELLVVAAETVTLLPLAVSVPVAVPLDPSTTLPTATVLGEIVKVPTVAVAVPVPVSVAVVSAVCASLVTVSIVDWDPAVVGLKVTVNEALFPAAIVCGRESPPTVKVELPVVAAETVTPLPFAVSVPVAVPLDPSTTLPTAIVLGEIVRVPTGAWLKPPALTP